MILLYSEEGDLSSNTNVEFEFDSSNISLAGKNTELMVNELFAANNGLVISSMLDSNIEIPINHYLISIPP